MQLAASIASGSGLGGLMLCHVAQALLQLLREMSKARTLSALDCMSRTIDVANVMFGLQEGLVRGLGTDMLQPGPKLTAQGGGDLVAAVTALILAVWDECGERIGMATPYPLASATQQARRSLVILVSQLETIAASQGTASISAVGQHLLHNACGRFS